MAVQLALRTDEAAARTILSLVTALLGVVFGVLAVAEDPLPAYFRLPLVRWLGVGTVVAVIAFGLGLVVLGAVLIIALLTAA